MVCGIIVPRQYDVMGYCVNANGGNCIRESGHSGEHVFWTTEGKLIAWQDDMECGCCEPDEDEQCYAYREIEASEIPNLPLK